MDRQFAAHLNTIKRTLRSIASDKELSFNEVADLAGVAHATVQNLFDSTTKNPQLRTIWRIARVMGLELDARVPTAKRLKVVS